jgi:shikimate dehydrogenase
MTKPSDKTRRACIMGHPVSQSRSPMIHGYWIRQLDIDGAYDFMDLEEGAFAGFVAGFGNNGYIGGNVTVPHKEAAFAAARKRDAAAEAIGAVNTLWLEDGVLNGGNSDAHGFIANLDDTAPGWDVPGGHAVIMGAGGSARAAAWALANRGLKVSLVNRTRSRADDLARHFGARVSGHSQGELAGLLPSADVLVNCTSCGMVGKPPLEIDLAPLKKSAVVYDVVYVPLDTQLLVEAKKRGHRTVDGLGMLLQQAGYGFGKWFGAKTTVTQELRDLIVADIVAKTPK